jgi:hypothetical protein
MASLGKKILSAFMEVDGEKTNVPLTNVNVETKIQQTVHAGSAAPAAAGDRFSEYFDNLFREANIPGPDYYEFARMITAMQAIPDERSRYVAAYAGLQVQGLDKEKLLSTATEYLRVLASDGDHFGSTVEAALQEKVLSRTTEVEEKSKRIEALSQEILGLQSQISTMQNEILEAKSRLEAGSNAYAAESERRKQQIQGDIQKIDNYIH